MSYPFLRAVLERAGPKVASHRLVMVVLAYHANEAGVSWPSIATISKKAGISPRQAKRIIHELLQERYITVEFGSGRNHVNKYRIISRENSDAHVTVPTSTNGDTDDTLPMSQKVSSATEKGDTGVQEKVTPRAKKGDVGDTRTFREQSMNRERMEEALSLDAAISLFSPQFPHLSEGGIRNSLRKMRQNFQWTLTEENCRRWLSMERDHGKSKNATPTPVPQSITPVPDNEHAKAAAELAQIRAMSAVAKQD